MTNPLISIVLPVFNGEKYLNLAIDSVIEQTYVNFELIIVDNNSTDSTRDIIQKYTARDKRVKSFICKEKGIVPALNKGLSKCNGTFIARIDDDDIWLTNKLEVQLEFFKHNPLLTLIGTSIILIDEKGNKLPPRRAFNNGMSLNQKQISRKLNRNNLFCHSSILIRKEVMEEMGGYSSRFTHCEDYYLWFNVVKNHNAEILENQLVYYRVHKESISIDSYVNQRINSFHLRLLNSFTMGNPVVNLFWLMLSTPKYIRYLILSFKTHLKKIRATS